MKVLFNKTANPMDKITQRLQELSQLEPGWLDGEGVSLDRQGCEWVKKILLALSSDKRLLKPYVYPTAEGNIQAEWALDKWEISVLFHLTKRLIDYMAVDAYTTFYHHVDGIYCDADIDKTVAQLKTLLHKHANTRISWDQYFMQIAHVVAKRSTCLRVPEGVGAVLVQDNRIVSTGYAGAIAGLPHCLEEGCLIDEKTGGCIRTVHAEQNAIIYANTPIDGNATLYCTLSPCIACFKLVAAYGVKRIAFAKEYRIVEPQKTFAQQLNVQWEQIDV